jgi:hypothetical protein
LLGKLRFNGIEMKYCDEKENWHGLSTMPVKSSLYAKRVRFSFHGKENIN